MFGALLGTLQKFRLEETKLKAKVDNEHKLIMLISKIKAFLLI